MTPTATGYIDSPFLISNQDMSHLAVIQGPSIPGSRRDSWQGLAEADFEGAYDDASSSFVGDYDVALGAPDGDATSWTPYLSSPSTTCRRPQIPGVIVAPQR